eukprot:6492410-Amphidinium_carterae.1
MFFVHHQNADLVEVHKCCYAMLRGHFTPLHGLLCMCYEGGGVEASVLRNPVRISKGMRHNKLFDLLRLFRPVSMIGRR